MIDFKEIEDYEIIEVFKNYRMQKVFRIWSSVLI